MATEQREKLHKVLQWYQYDQEDHPVYTTLEERSEADLVMLECIMTTDTYKHDIEAFTEDFLLHESEMGATTLEEWYKEIDAEEGKPYVTQETLDMMEHVDFLIHESKMGATTLEVCITCLFTDKCLCKSLKR